jgi:hypothetical protein
MYKAYSPIAHTHDTARRQEMTNDSCQTKKGLCIYITFSYFHKFLNSLFTITLPLGRCYLESGIKQSTTK